MREDLHKWWGNLSKNWQKVILVNYDLYHYENLEIDKITKEIISKDEFNAYKVNTGRRIKEYYDNFKPTIENLRAIVAIPNLTIQHPELTEIKPLLEFKNLKSLTLQRFSINSMRDFGELIHLEKLWLIDCLNLITLEGIDKLPRLSEIKLTYCNNLKNIESINHSNSLVSIDISNVGTLIDLNIKLNNRTFKIDKSNIHPDENYYKRKFNKQFKQYSDYSNKDQEYILDDEEIRSIFKKGNEKQKKNYLQLFSQENKIKIEIEDYSVWKIKTSGNNVHDDHVG